MNQNIRSIQDYGTWLFTQPMVLKAQYVYSKKISGTNLLNEGLVGETLLTGVRQQASQRSCGDRRPLAAPSCSSGRGNVKKSIHILSFLVQLDAGRDILKQKIKIKPVLCSRVLIHKLDQISPTIRLDLIHKLIVAKENFSLFIKSAAKIVETKISGFPSTRTCYYVNITKHRTHEPRNIFFTRHSKYQSGGFFQVSASDSFSSKILRHVANPSAMQRRALQLRYIKFFGKFMLLRICKMLVQHNVYLWNIKERVMNQLSNSALQEFLFYGGLQRLA